MTSEKQIFANQLNAQKAGIKTQEGKDRSRFNSTKHGLRASILLVDAEGYKETAQQLESYFSDLASSLKPEDDFEHMLIQKVALAQLKLQRADAIEKCCFEGSFHLSETFGIRDAAQLELILRYRRAYEGEFYRALAGLREYRLTKDLQNV